MKRSIFFIVFFLSACNQDGTPTFVDSCDGGCVDVAKNDAKNDTLATVCGDDLLDSGEECDTTNLDESTCQTLGFFGGTLSCNTACELELGGCDSDGDGIADEVEVASSSDPENLNSWPDTIWPNRMYAAEADGVSGVGWSTGAVPLDYKLTDQRGEPLSLHQLYGYVVLINVGGMWCAPCQAAAKNSNAHWEKYRDNGVIFVDALVQNFLGEPSTKSNLEMWGNEFGILFPVTTLTDPTQTTEITESVDAFPTWFLLDRKLRVVKKWEGWTVPDTETEISDEIDLIISQ